jgi:hypothetical protein
MSRHKDGRIQLHQLSYLCDAPVANAEWEKAAKDIGILRRKARTVARCATVNAFLLPIRVSPSRCLPTR